MDLAVAVAEATARRAEGSAEEAEDATSDLAVVAIAADLEAGEGKFLQIIVDPCFFFTTIEPDIAVGFVCKHRTIRIR